MMKIILPQDLPTLLAVRVVYDVPGVKPGTKPERRERSAVIFSDHSIRWGFGVSRDQLGVHIDGDATHAGVIVDLWLHHVDWPADEKASALEYPFIAAHVAHSQLRNLRSAEVDSLARKVVEDDGGKNPRGAEQLAGWLTANIAKIRESIGDPPLSVDDATRDAAGVVSADLALAGFIERMGDTGKSGAGKLRTPSTRGPWARWLTATPDEPSVPALCILARVGWLDVVKPRMNAPVIPLRFPQPVAQAMTHDRPKTIAAVRSRKKPDGLSIDWATSVLVESPGVQLVLPLDVQVAKGTTLYSVLTGGLLRTYLATWAACADSCNAHRSISDGLFVWDEAAIFRDYFGQAKAGGRNLKLMRDDFEELQKIKVASVGDVDIKEPQPLISKYEHRHSGRSIYQHAAAVSLFMGNNFAQVPRAVLKLSADDVPIALGIAAIERRFATSMLASGNAHEGDLETLLRACGLDVEGGIRKDGPGNYFRRSLHKIASVAASGALGTVARCDGAPISRDDGGPVSADTRVRLVMHDHLASAYRPLFEAANRQKREAKRLPGKVRG